MAKLLTWSGLDSNRFDLRAAKKWWPPFFATSFFFPRLNLNLKNLGEAIEAGYVEVSMGLYDGPMANVAAAKVEWRSAAGERFSGWAAGQTRTFSLTLADRALPKEGTYLTRVLVVEEVPQPPDIDDLMVAMKAAVDANDISQAVRVANELRRTAEDPPTGNPDQSSTLMYRQIFDATIHEYLRVDSLPTVLSFWALISSLILGIGTVLIGIAANT